MTFSIPKLCTRSQVPGTGNQSYMPRPSCTCRLFPETKSMSYICNDDLSTSCNTHVYLPTTRLYPLNPIQELLLTTKTTTKTQSTSQLFLEINHVVSASGQLMPSHSQLTKSTTTSYNIGPSCFLVLKKSLKILKSNIRKSKKLHQ